MIIEFPTNAVEGFESERDAWLMERCGYITGSRFKDILTEPRSKTAKENHQLSDKAHSYLIETIAARLTRQIPVISSAPLEWGNEHESNALTRYEELTKYTVNPAGFLKLPKYPDDIGGTPDGLIAEDGLIEIKCPYNSVNHLKTIDENKVPAAHMPQIQGYLWLTGRKWCDFVSYDPRIPKAYRCDIFIQRVQRDEDYIAHLEKKVVHFMRFLHLKMKVITGIDALTFQRVVKKLNGRIENER
jgi:hypothetical protein